MKLKLYFLLILFGLILNINAQIPTNGLVGYWPFNGNSNDVSGNNLNGVVNGAVITSDRFGNENSAYAFDGNSYIEIAPSPSINTANLDAVSISIWGNLGAYSAGNLNRYFNLSNFIIH